MVLDRIHQIDIHTRGAEIKHSGGHERPKGIFSRDSVKVTGWHSIEWAEEGRTIFDACDCPWGAVASYQLVASHSDYATRRKRRSRMAAPIDGEGVAESEDHGE